MPGRQPERSRHGRRAKHSELARPAQIASLDNRGFLQVFQDQNPVASVHMEGAITALSVVPDLGLAVGGSSGITMLQFPALP